MGLGISVLIGLKAAVMFLLFAYLRSFGFILSSIPFLYTSVIALLISIASHPSINLPMLLGKSTDGSFPIWSIIMFGPYLYFVRVFSALRRLRLGEAPYSEICDGLFVGGWPYAPDKLPPDNPAIIDCTCELPRKPEFSGHAYLCVPTWDTRAPQPAEIEAAVQWACRKRAQNRPVFIHCAYGHGRSVAVMCALLVALDVVEDWKNAERLVREKRPYIHMNALHRQALVEWSKDRLSSPVKKREIHITSPVMSDSSGGLRSVRTAKKNE
ncbi:hypothetical protein CJ030_MR1G015706 [Morella rubra]|uniref:Tyrosine specific protein phosphatases domain-containing protein n=1 Tax=Morella rubra TaxID=262757 RepID=A0A6A1WJQ1_9ROSI|nr:hypothetical protein CJ030_MR1G015706 [Morella rubra]